MTELHNKTYWQVEFAVTEADMNRLENFILETGQAYDLTTMIKRVIRGRLRHGQEVSPAALGVKTSVANRSVRLWDPTREWKVGDHAIVAVRLYNSERNYELHVGEVLAIEGSNVRVRLSALGQNRLYGTTPIKSPQDLIKWRQFVETLAADLMAARNEAADPEADLELILLEHGDHISSQLLDALRADNRFVLLNGRWFLHRLAVLPSPEQLRALAWTMLNLEEPQSTEALLPLITPSTTPDDPGLFGLYLALRDHPQLFANADPGQRPRWVLTGPPPGLAKARYAAYDPETYQVLCEPEETITEDVAKRLWKLELFGTICTPME